MRSIPDLDPESLASDWKNRLYSRSTQDFGERWAKSMLSCALKIPFFRIPLASYPQEHNLLSIPITPIFRPQVRILEEWEVSFEVNH